MNFYIAKIRLWFKHDQGTRDLDFFQDKVNVITGDSSTGKSSVLKIIDYCNDFYRLHNGIKDRSLP